MVVPVAGGAWISPSWSQGKTGAAMKSAVQSGVVLELWASVSVVGETISGDRLHRSNTGHTNESKQAPCQLPT